MTEDEIRKLAEQEKERNLLFMRPLPDGYIAYEQGFIAGFLAAQKIERNKAIDEAIERMDYHPLLNQHFDIIKEVLESLKQVTEK